MVKAKPQHEVAESTASVSPKSSKNKLELWSSWKLLETDPAGAVRVAS